MKYLILMYGDEQRWAAATDAERVAELDAHRAFSAAVAQRATMLGGEALAGADTTTALGPATHGGQRPVTDGPMPRRSNSWVASTSCRPEIWI